MSDSTMTALVKALAEAATPDHTIAPGPAFKTARTGDALKRCRAAWQRAFDASVTARRNRKQDEFMLTDDAAKDACKAYRNAMPVLSGYEGIRDFIACAAYGILIDAINPQMSGQLLYAAQVALGTLPHQPKPPKAQSTKPPTPSPEKRKKW